MRITSEEARALIDDGRGRAAALGKAMTFCVVDAGGFLVALERMDGARPMTPSIATAKAYTAAVMQRPSALLKDWSASDPVFFGQVARMGHHPIVATRGGYTLKRGDEFLGGFGVSGGSPDEDEEICSAVVAGAGFDMTFQAWAGAKRS
ncbi:heme-binding protein [Actinomadura sp. DC4]|uniref:GlcG/HbpS family heme-binding protein n=1 Tax=Actinomadura sp. DC4 TaxID=3055069 RepID=UPI0025B1479B|nr:heme-binding protein [Actinomadura sp. DC4]MDN3359073.1 heme-binding protein [Actinomadura sp. DC4]